MWRKQEEPKPSSPAVESPPAPPAVVRDASVERPATPGRAEARTDRTTITRSISIHGDVSGREDLYIDGQVEGTIRLAENSLTIGPNGRVSAEIEAREVVIEGQVKGNVSGRERVAIRATGSVSGDIVTGRIAIEEGAVLRGTVEISRPEDARSASPPREAAAAAGAGARTAGRPEIKNPVQ